MGYINTKLKNKAMVIKKKGSNSETLAMKAYADDVEDVAIEETASIESINFVDHLILLYGPPKIGKTTFAASIQGCYIVASEPGFRALKCRKSYVKNWAQFRLFIEKIEKDKKVLGTIRVFALDTIDNLAKFCMQYTCGRLQIGHPSDLQWGKGWEAYRDEFTYWLLRLCALGKGLLFISHEGEKEIVYKGISTSKSIPSLPKTCYTVVNNLVDFIIRMGYDIETGSSKDRIKGKLANTKRCLMTRSHLLYDAGNRTKVGVPEKIFFETELEAYKTIQKCFE